MSIRIDARAKRQPALENGMLEIDSTLIENSIRPMALDRKNCVFVLMCHGAIWPQVGPDRSTGQDARGRRDAVIL